MNKRFCIKKYLGCIAFIALMPAASRATEHIIKPIDTKKLIGEMVVAGVIDTNSRVFIDYSIRGIFINGARLSSAAEAQWKRIFTAYDVPVPEHDHDGTTITIKPDAAPAMRKVQPKLSHAAPSASNG